MTVLEDLVKSQLGDKMVTVPDISDDAIDHISDSKVLTRLYVFIWFLMTLDTFSFKFLNHVGWIRLSPP